MVKCYAPHAASHRGKAIQIAKDGSCELSAEALAELLPHGFREWMDKKPVARHPRGLDPVSMSRQELLEALKGKGPGNAAFMKTDDLRALAAEILAEHGERSAARPVQKSSPRASTLRKQAKAARKAPWHHGHR